MSRIKVGRYSLGAREIDLFIDSDVRGQFSTHTSSGVTEIVVGKHQDRWWQTVGDLTHESLELMLADLGCRYAPDLDVARGSDCFIFIMDHAKFSEAVARVGHFLTECLPDLAKIKVKE